MDKIKFQYGEKKQRIGSDKQLYVLQPFVDVTKYSLFGLIVYETAIQNK